MFDLEYKTYIINDKNDFLAGEMIVGKKYDEIAISGFLRRECIESSWYTRVPKKSKVKELTLYYIFKYYKNKNIDELTRLVGFLKKYYSLPYKDMNKFDNYLEKLKLAEKLKQ